MKIRLAFLVPALANRGPILVVRDIIAHLDQSIFQDVVVFYFDEVASPIAISATKKKIAFSEQYDFVGFDIVHTHGIRPDYYIRRNRKRIKSFCISTTHNIIKEEYCASHNRLVGVLMEKLWIHALKKHDLVVTLSLHMQAYYKALLPNMKTAVIYNGRSLSPYKTDLLPVDRDKLVTIKGRYRIIGSACVVTKRKGLHQIITALPELPNYAFVLVGEGPALADLMTLAKKLGVGERCLFLGSKKDVKAYLTYFDLYAMLSYTEGVPLALLEAASLGLPAVCSAIPVHQEMFNEQEVAFFTLNHKNSLIEAVHSAYTHRASLSQRIQQAYLHRFTAEYMAKQYQSLYMEHII